MFLLILFSFFCCYILIIGIVIEVVKIYLRIFCGSKVTFAVVLGNTEAFIHGKDVSCQIHNSIPVSVDNKRLTCNIHIIGTSDFYVKEVSCSSNQTINVYGFYNLLSRCCLKINICIESWVKLFCNTFFLL